MSIVKTHKHLIIRAEALKPPTDEAYLEQWLKRLIESINMKIMVGPFVKYCDMPGNRGITGGAIIETSHVIMHIWDECTPAIMQFDLYSCSDFDHQKICQTICSEFNVSKIEYKYLDRDNGLKIID